MKKSSASTVIALLAALIGSVEGVLALTPDDPDRHDEEHGLTRGGGADPRLRHASSAGSRRLDVSPNLNTPVRQPVAYPLPERPPAQLPQPLSAEQTVDLVHCTIALPAAAASIFGMPWSVGFKGPEEPLIFIRRILPQPDEPSSPPRIQDSMGKASLDFIDAAGTRHDAEAEIAVRTITDADLIDLDADWVTTDFFLYDRDDWTVEIIFTPTGPQSGSGFPPPDIGAIKMYGIFARHDFAGDCTAQIL